MTTYPKAFKYFSYFESLLYNQVFLEGTFNCFYDSYGIKNISMLVSLNGPNLRIDTISKLQLNILTSRSSNSNSSVAELTTLTSSY